MGTMRALLPTPNDTVDVHECYARDWIERGGIRVNMISSMDGAASAAGLSSGLQTPGDNLVYAALRDLADVVLVGAGTARAEGYGPVVFNSARAAIRERHGIAPLLPVALVSRSLNLDVSSRLFVDADPGNRPIVVTVAAADPVRLAGLKRVADVVVAGERDVEPPLVRRLLAERGLTRVLCEGGPTLFAQLAASGEVDEVCLSLSPILAGPGAQRIVAGGGWLGGPRRYALLGLLEDDGALFLRLGAGSR